MTTTMTLADLAATSLSAIRVLENHGLDYCCGGKQPLDEACLAKGIKPEAIVREIEEAKTATVAGRDWQTAPLDELVKHIVEMFKTGRSPLDPAVTVEIVAFIEAANKSGANHGAGEMLQV